MSKRRPAGGTNGRAEPFVICPIIARTSKRRALLASTAFTGAFIAVIAGNPGSALAQSCSTSGSNPVTITCDAPGGTITTTGGTNSTSPNAATNARQQSFGADMIGIVTANTTIDGFGLRLLPPGGQAVNVTMTNNGVVTTNQAATSALSLGSDGGTISYSGNGSAISSNGGTGLSIANAGSGNVLVGLAGTPVTGTFTGASGMAITTAAGSQAIFLNGGSVTATSNTGSGLSLTSTSGNISATLTGNTAILNSSGALGASTGIRGFTTSGGITINSTANIGTALGTSAFNTGIGTQASGAGAIAITQTDGTIFANVDGLEALHSGSGSASITAVGSTITAGGTGIMIQQTGTGDVNVAAGGTVTGGNYGIQARQLGASGNTTVDVAAGSAITGALSGIVATAAGNVTVTVGDGATVTGGAGSNGVLMGGAGTGTLTNRGTVTAGTGINTGGGQVTVTNFGSIIGTGGTAVSMPGANSVFVMSGPSATLTGNAVGSGTNTFRFAGSGANSFNASQIGLGWTLIDKTDASNWTLTGTSTTTAAVTVNGGTLSVNGNITSASSVTVNSGGTLGGTGTVTSTTINAGGVLAPGNSIGTLTVAGNLVFGAGSIYRVEIAGAASDRTNVTGTATLTGGTVLLVPTGTSFARTFTILSAAGGLGGTTFAGVTGTNLTGTLSYTATDVIVDVTAALGAGAALTPNQSSVASTFNTIFNTGGTLPTASIFNLTGGSLSAALDQLSGEVHASTASALVDESSYMRSAILGRLRQASYGGDVSMAALALGGPRTSFADDAFEGALAYAKSPIVTKAPVKPSHPTSDIVFWSQGFGGWGKFNSDGNAAALNRNLAGFISGFDMRFGNWRGGLAAGYTSSHNNTDGRGSADVESGHVAAYGGTRVGAFNLRAGGTFAWHTIDTDRSIAFTGFSDRATAHYNGRTGQLFGEVGYGLAFGKVAVEPFAGAAWVRLDTDAFSEKGGAAALNVAANSFEVGYSTLGVRAASLVPLDNGMVLIPRASLAWQHAFGSVTPATALAFQTAPANTFTISGAPIARDAALAEAGLDLAINSHATVGVSYTGQFAGSVTDHAAKGKFSWKF